MWSKLVWCIPTWKYLRVLLEIYGQGRRWRSFRGYIAALWIGWAAKGVHGYKLRKFLDSEFQDEKFLVTIEGKSRYPSEVSGSITRVIVSIFQSQTEGAKDVRGNENSTENDKIYTRMEFWVVGYVNRAVARMVVCRMQPPSTIRYNLHFNSITVLARAPLLYLYRKIGNQIGIWFGFNIRIVHMAAGRICQL